MNEIPACGRDDADAQDGLVQWDPVVLTQSEYDRVVRDLKQRGHHGPSRAVGIASCRHFDALLRKVVRFAPSEPRRPDRGPETIWARVIFLSAKPVDMD